MRNRHMDVVAVKIGWASLNLRERMHAVLTRDRWLSWAALLAAAGALYATAPTDGDFWWFDAPVHAMNGVFVRDFIAATPVSDPAGFAENYFTTYPALSILFYPPLFYGVEAAAFEIFGIHAWAAQLTVSAFTVAFAAGVFAISRRLGILPALAAALIALAMPATALWSRQIMLEIPACAFIAWSAHHLLCYLEKRAVRPLLLSAFLMCCALYTKQTVAFMVPVEAAAVLLVAGWGAVRRREIWIAVGASVVFLLPLALMTLAFGRFNFEQAAGLGNDLPPVLSIASFTWYLERIPAETGWITLVLTSIGGWLVLRYDTRRSKPLFVLMGLWLAFGYVFFSLIHLKQPRHILPIYVPLAVLSAWALDRIAREIEIRWLTPVLAAALFGWTLAVDQVPRVSGQREAAVFVAARTRPGDRIMFHGHRSGSFIFAMRELAGNGQPVATLRADKFLVHYRIDRDFGLTDLERSKKEIAAIFKDYAIRDVVFQTGFWTDVPSVRRFEEVLRSRLFVKAAEFPIKGAEAPGRLVVFEYQGPAAKQPAPIVIDVPAIGHKITGRP